MAYVKGLDASHWVNPDWSSWADRDFVFTWNKASEGTTFVDNKYQQHTDNSLLANFYVAPFHYFRVQENGALQAGHFHNVVGNSQVDMPPMVDVEKYNNEGYSKAVFAARLRNCLLETEALFGVRPTIYTSRNMWHLLVGSVAWATAYDLHVAHYTSYPIPLLPDDWKGKGWKVWQHASKPLDQNRFNGDLAAFLAWINQSPSLPPPSGELEQRVADLEVINTAHHEAYHNGQ